MNSHFLNLVVSCAVAVGLASCAPTREERIAKNATYFSTLSHADQAAVQQGRLRVGMPRDAVLIALGKPAGIAERVSPSGTGEILTYIGYQAVYTYPRFPVGPVYDPHGRCVHYHDQGPEVVQVPYVKCRVFLRGGKVVSWVQEKTSR